MNEEATALWDQEACDYAHVSLGVSKNTTKRFLDAGLHVKVYPWGQEGVKYGIYLVYNPLKDFVLFQALFQDRLAALERIYLFDCGFSAGHAYGKGKK